MDDLHRQIGVIKKILQASDQEVSDYRYMYECISEFGIYPYGRTVQEYGDSCYFTKNGILQVPGEFAQFCCFLSSWEIKDALEVGVFRGRSSYLICAILYRKNKDLTYDMVDIMDMLDGFEEFKKVLPPLQKNIPHTSSDFKDKAYEFVFIDADHSYEGSITDYFHVGKNATKLCVFHDIYAHEYDEQHGGTVRMWKEVAANTPGCVKLTFSQFPDEWMGIGVCVNLLSECVGQKGQADWGEALPVREAVEDFKGWLRSHKKVYLYGAGNISRNLLPILHRAGIEVEGIVVSDEYLDKNPCSVEGKRVRALSDVEVSSQEAAIAVFIDGRTNKGIVSNLRSQGAKNIYELEGFVVAELLSKGL